MSGYSQSPPEGSAQSDSHYQGPARKKMRKGTRSCLECRRRKIKCTFEPGRTAVCNECYARGSTCIDQEHGDVQSYAQTTTTDQSSYSLRERVTQLEGLVKDVLHRIPDNGINSTSNSTPEVRNSGGSTDTQTAAEVLKSLRTSTAPHFEEEPLELPDYMREGAPALSLFDNAVLSRKDSPPEMSRSRYNKSKSLVAQLNSLLPSPRDLEIILDDSSDWWNVWRVMYPEITDPRCATIKESVGHSLRSENPGEIGKILLCIALSIYQLPADWDFRKVNLNGSRTEVMEHYVNTIDRLVSSDDEIAATLDGIECIVLQAKYHINLGRPRKSWLLFRRAVSFAQLLGLHRLSSRKPVTPDRQWERQVQIWRHLFQGDRYLSLVLGLPYSINEQFCTPYIPPIGATSDMQEGELYLTRATSIVARITDRNQNPQNMPFSATLRIDQDLEELAHTQPSTWWKLCGAKEAGISLEQHFDRRAAQFFHHHIRSLLHMPFMLKSSADKRYQYSHTAALESSREMIKIYESLRTETYVSPFICKLVDFQAFTAAVLILLNLLGYSQQAQGSLGPQHDHDQSQEDSALVDKTIEILNQASQEPGGHVSAQSAKALEVLAMGRHCTEDEHKNAGKDASVQISIPFFGNIRIGAGKNFVLPRSGTYPKPGAPRKWSTYGGTNAGLPTPPSVSSHSTQPSPASAYLDGQAQMNQAQFTNNQYLAPEQNQALFGGGGDDPFISFDSFMALPPQEYPNVSSGNGATMDMMQNNGVFDPGAGYHSTGFPFPQWGNTDLDNSWIFQGIDAPQHIAQ